MVRAIDVDKAMEVAQIKYNDWNLAMAAADGQREINLCFKKQELFKAVKAVLECVPTLTPPNEWVAVEDRLPQLRENVLVCAYWHEHWGVYIGWNNGHGWTVSCGIGQRNDVQVSHWMLLPAPPAKGGDR